MEELTCENCRHWMFLRETEKDVGIGECRIRAPSINPQYAQNPAIWPLTMFDDWCSELEQKGKKM